MSTYSILIGSLEQDPETLKVTVGLVLDGTYDGLRYFEFDPTELSAEAFLRDYPTGLEESLSAARERLDAGETTVLKHIDLMGDVKATLKAQGYTDAEIAEAAATSPLLTKDEVAELRAFAEK